MNLFQQVISRIAGLDREVERRVEEEKRGWETVVIEAWRGNNAASSAGASVTPGNSMQLSSVYSSIRLMSEVMAGLPLPFYEWIGDDKQKAPDFYLYDLLNLDPNPEMTAFEYRETLQQYLMRWGNAYSRIIYSTNALDGGEVRELWPWDPGNILQTRMDRGIKYYQYQDEEAGTIKWYPATDIWHIKGMGNGKIGYNPTALMKRALGLGMSAEEFGAKFFENDATLGTVIEHPQHLSDKAYQHLKESFEEEHKGSAKAHKPHILEEGMKINKTGVEPDHAQFLETRKFQVTEVARMERIPPHLIGDLDRATFSNIEQQSIEFVIFSLAPWCIRWEQSIQKRLMLPAERKRYFPEHLVDGLLRGDTLSRYQAYREAINSGWFTRADARKKENLEPIAGLEEPLVPMNMVPASQAGITAAAGGNPGGDKREIRNARDRKKAAEQRLFTARAFKEIFLRTDERAIKREIQDVIKGIRKILVEDAEGNAARMQAWLEEYYEGFHKTLRDEYWAPNFNALSEAINAQAAIEVGGPVGMTRGLEECLDYHVDRSALRHITISKLGLMEAIQAGLAEIKADNLSALDDLFDNWKKTRPEEFARWEVIRTTNLMAKATWFYQEVKGLEWVRLDNNPFCKTLDGKVIEMGTSCRGTHFVGKNDEVVADERAKVLKPSWNVATPPLYSECECMIAPIKE